MKLRPPRAFIAIAALTWCSTLTAKPVLIAETAEKTRYYADDATVKDLPSVEGPIHFRGPTRLW